MNTKTFLIAGLLLMVGIATAQNPSMKRDIEVAENILSTLIQQETDARFGTSIEGTYIEGQGALFTIGGGSLFSFGSYTITGLRKEGIVIGRGSRDRDRADAPPSPEPERREVNVDSINEVMHAQLKSAMKTFLRDYAHLLTELTPNEKVIVRYNADRQFSAVVYTSSATGFFNAQEKEEKETLREITAEVEKSSIDQYRNGQLSAKQFEERIKFKELTTSNKSYADLELLSSIFHRLYQGDLSKTFHMIGQPNYEKIEGLGAIFDMRFGLLALGVGHNMVYYFHNNDQIAMLRKKNEEEKNKHTEIEKEDLKKRYDDFVSGFSQNIIEYGRTVKNIATNEIIIFKVDLSACPECDIPGKIELTIKKSVLEDYDKNKISLEQAIAQVSVKTTQRER